MPVYGRQHDLCELRGYSHLKRGAQFSRYSKTGMRGIRPPPPHGMLEQVRASPAAGDAYANYSRFGDQAREPKATGAPETFRADDVCGGRTAFTPPLFMRVEDNIHLVFVIRGSHRLRWG